MVRVQRHSEQFWLFYNTILLKIIYIYCYFFNPVIVEEGTLQSGRLDYLKFEHLNILGKEVNINNITVQILFQEKT